jgi:hypothetical protein
VDGSVISLSIAHNLVLSICLPASITNAPITIAIFQNGRQLQAGFVIFIMGDICQCFISKCLFANHRTISDAGRLIPFRIVDFPYLISILCSPSMSQTNMEMFSSPRIVFC